MYCSYWPCVFQVTECYLFLRCSYLPHVYQATMSLCLCCSYLPLVYQATLASATLSEDVLSLKSLVLHNPVILKLQEPELAPATQLTHYHLAAEEDEKAAILYALLKLRLVRGKSIIFVNSVDRCYKYVNVCIWLNK